MLGSISSFPLAHFTLVPCCGHVMAGVQHAPLSGNLPDAELTEGYELFVPLMFVSAIPNDHDHLFPKRTACTWCQLKEKGRQLSWIQRFRSSGFNHHTQCWFGKRTWSPIHPMPSSVIWSIWSKISKRNIFPVVADDGALRRDYHTGYNSGYYVLIEKNREKISVSQLHA